MLNINSSNHQLPLLPISIAISATILTACNTAPRNDAKITTRTPVAVTPNYSVNDNYNRNVGNNPNVSSIPRNYNNSPYQQKPFTNNGGANYNQGQPTNNKFPKKFSEPPISVYDKPYIADHINSEKNSYKPNSKNYGSTNNKGKRFKYVVQDGDNLSSIAKRANVSVQELAKWNHMHQDDVLKANSIIYLYNGKTVPPKARISKSNQNNKQKSDYYIVRDGEGLIGISQKVGLTLSQLAAYNNLDTNAHLVRKQKLWLVPGKVKRSNIQKASKSATSHTNVSKVPTYKGQTSKYKIKSGDTLIGLAKKLDTTTNIIASLNDFESSYHVKKGEYIKVPASKVVVDIALNNKDALYKVKRGDTLIGVSNRFNVDISRLANANKLTPKSQLIKGATIRIPANSASNHISSTKKSSSLPAKGQSQKYVVKSGDSLTRLAKKHNLPVSKLAHVNGLTVHDDLIINQTLTIPTVKSKSTYIVRSGDSLTKLAARYGVTRAKLASMNGLSSESELDIGQIIEVPAN